MLTPNMQNIFLGAIFFIKAIMSVLSNTLFLWKNYSPKMNKRNMLIARFLKKGKNLILSQVKCLEHHEDFVNWEKRPSNSGRSKRFSSRRCLGGS